MTSCLRTSKGESIPLQGVEILGDVLGGHAHLRFRQRYRNDDAVPVEAIYVFPLPADGTLVGFSMSCNGRTIEGAVKEREEAFRSYDDAVFDGHGAALLEQERPNVFTASIGNLVPGEETVIEVRVIQRVQGDEGALRILIPTLVAPRYIPTAGASGPVPDRTAHGAADPTAAVPDADRISPPTGAPDYGLRLELVFDLGRDLDIESPSHPIQVVREGGKVRVSLRRDEVPLDRDVVVVARGVESGPLRAATVHRDGDDRFVALTVVPDLGAAAPTPLDVVFVVDTSGSMGGASIVEARAALRLCLRHLREGDRFNVIRFASDHSALFARPEPFTQRSLERADAWVKALEPDGGTELMAPLAVAVGQAPRGVVVLLTDGQVGNENQILAHVLAERRETRIYTFGIGTNVSDALLRDLAKKTGGAVEMIHPGERIDEKVVAQFARAGARRVTDVKVTWSGMSAEELAPMEPPALIDNDPWVLYARVRGGGVGEAQIRGDLDGQPFYLAVPVDLDGAGSQPLLPKLWAAERVRALEMEGLEGRRAERMKERIVALGVTYGIATRFTSFIAVETRTGDRRASGHPETRVVPVHAPAGWAQRGRGVPVDSILSGQGSFSGPVRHRIMSAGAMPSAPQMTMGVPQSPTNAAPGPVATKGGGFLAEVAGLFRGTTAAAEPPSPAPMMAAGGDILMGHVTTSVIAPGDATGALLLAQLASGLWGPSEGSEGSEGDDELRARATVQALLQLLRAGVGAAHPIHGAQVKKAVEAVVKLAGRLETEPRLRELLLAAAWLLADGKRLRARVAKELGGAPQEAAVRARVDELAAGM